MLSKTILVLCIVTMVTAIPPGSWGGWGAPVGTNFLPPWIASAPWYSQWTPCTAIGSSCADCSTKLVCTKIGGLQRACTDPTLPHCNLGECSATPSAECAAPSVPDDTAT